jgi:hypothetical protein
MLEYAAVAIAAVTAWECARSLLGGRSEHEPVAPPPDAAPAELDDLSFDRAALLVTDVAQVSGGAGMSAFLYASRQRCHPLNGLTIDQRNWLQDLTAEELALVARSMPLRLESHLNNTRSIRGLPPVRPRPVAGIRHLAIESARSGGGPGGGFRP